jgi:hypothetical protein
MFISANFGMLRLYPGTFTRKEFTMNLLLAALRLIHIVAAFGWVGLSMAMGVYILPAATVIGESGLRFFKALYARTPFTMAFAATSGVTVLAGILLYLLGASSHYSSLGNIVLGIGALAGLAAGVHGGAVIGRASRAFEEALKQQVPDGQPIAAEALTALSAAERQLAEHSRLALILTAIALIGMASARYL